MIGKLTGVFGGTTPDGAVLVEVGGVGYAVRVPFATLQKLLTRKHRVISLIVHTAVREDAIDLYGFGEADELTFFRLLMGVKGIGPKTALGIMSVADASTLKQNIAQGDATSLTKVFGIGKRTAERIVVELKDKISSGGSPASSLGATSSEDIELLEALMALGYSAAESREALRRIAPDVTGVHNRLAAALRWLGNKKV